MTKVSIDEIRSYYFYREMKEIFDKLNEIYDAVDKVFDDSVIKKHRNTLETILTLVKGLIENQ